MLYEVKNPRRRPKTPAREKEVIVTLFLSVTAQTECEQYLNLLVFEYCGVVTTLFFSIF